jgi:hypothetical protein
VSTTNCTPTGLWSNPGLCGDRPAMKVNVNCVKIFSSYRAVNTLSLGYKNQSANFVEGYNRLLFCGEDVEFLGAYVQLRIATVSFVMSLRTYETTRLPEHGYLWSVIFDCFPTSVEKILVLLKSDKNNGYFSWRRLWQYIAELFVEWEMFRVKVVEKIKTHFMFKHFFPPKNRAFYERMWKVWYSRW